MILVHSGCHWANVKYGIFEFCLELEKDCFAGLFISSLVVLTRNLLTPVLPWLLPQYLPPRPLLDNSLPILVICVHVSILLELFSNTARRR